MGKRENSYGSLLPKKWHVGVYLRISREDGDKEESNSISSQKDLIAYYIQTHAGLSDTREYVDDGWSGTNFNRPGFSEMLRDIKSGLINCVVVKDLSRFGRNYIEVGQYLEVVFPMLNVRFIAVNDNIDSVGNPDSLNTAIVPFKNIMNDEYCRDISNKVRSVLTNKRRQGKFIGSFASYGYRKDPNDHNHLIIDEETAPVVRDIFTWFLSGMGVITIAKLLNEQGVLNPSAYKRSLGMKYHHPQHDLNDTLWPDSSVRRILTNRLYVGDLVQGKTKTRSYKLSAPVNIPQDNWIIVENTHEPIIDRETFDKVQDIFARSFRTPPKANRCYVLSGYVRCADCKRAMNRKLISQPYADYGYYVCSTFKKMNQGVCTKHTIRSDKLENAVLETLKAHIALAVSLDEAVASLRSGKENSGTSIRLERMLEAKRQEISAIEDCKLDLYPDWKSGAISREEYDSLKARFDKQLAALQKEIDRIDRELDTYRHESPEQNPFLTYFLAHRNIEKLTREVVVELIDMIYVHEGGEITIKLKYQDEYLRLLDFLHEKGIEVPAMKSAG